MGLRGFTGVDSEGFSGGLALFWHESIEVIVKDATARYIDVWMRISPDEPMFHATFVYGEPRTENRHRMWSSLSTLCASSSLPWALIGDFNEALWSYEHLSAVPRAESQMAAFRDCVQRCLDSQVYLSHMIIGGLEIIMCRYAWIERSPIMRGGIYTQTLRWFTWLLHVLTIVLCSGHWQGK
jgi:hypothetical protein